MLMFHYILHLHWQTVLLFSPPFTHLCHFNHTCFLSSPVLMNTHWPEALAVSLSPDGAWPADYLLLFFLSVFTYSCKCTSILKHSPLKKNVTELQQFWSIWIASQNILLCEMSNFMEHCLRECWTRIGVVSSSPLPELHANVQIPKLLHIYKCPTYGHTESFTHSPLMDMEIMSLLPVDYIFVPYIPLMMSVIFSSMLMSENICGKQWGDDNLLNSEEIQ